MLYLSCTDESVHSCWTLNLTLDLRESRFHTSGRKLNCNQATTGLWSEESVAPP